MKKILVILLVVALLLTSCARGGEVKETTPPTTLPEDAIRISWESMHGPPGGQINKLIQSPYGNHELYAVSVRGVHKSEDKGESWQLIDALDGIKVNSIALFEDKLFVGGDGVYCYDKSGNLAKVLEHWCDEVIVSNNKLFAFIASGGRGIKDRKILYTDLASEHFDWKDISPTASELGGLRLPPPGSGLWYHMKVPNIVALGSRILANIIMEVEGSGERTNGHLYISEDSGKTWSQVALDVPDDVIISNIIQDPANPEHIFLTFRHPVLHDVTYPVSELLRESYDGGKTWNRVIDLTTESNGVTDVAIIGSVYYIPCPWDDRILKLDGSSYELIDMPRVEEFERIMFRLDILLFDFDDPNIVYGKTGSVWALGLVKSEDGMKTWKKMDRDIVASSPTIVIPHPTDPNTVLTSGNIIQESYMTRDGGGTWEPFSPVEAGDEVAFDPHNPGHIILVDENTYIFESYDGGRTFTQIAQDFSSAKVFDFEIAQDDPGKIYVSNNGVGISESLGQGNWHYLTNSPDYAYDIEIDPDDSNILYASYSPKIFENYSSIWRYSKYQKENFGWSELLRVENSGGITSLEFDPSNFDRLYAGVTGEEGTVYVSNDKGKTWDKLNEDLTFTTIWGHSQLKVDPTDKNTVYAGTWGGGSYKTTDGGKSWTMMDEEHTFSPVCLAIYHRNPNIIYACDRTNPKIHRSVDGGETWTEYYDFGEGYMLTSTVLIDPDDPDVIYASAFQPPVAISGGLIKIKNGKKVAELNKGLPRSVVEIEIDRKNKDTLYVCTHAHGVFKSVDGGASWERLDDKDRGLPRTGFYDIDVDPVDSNILYATCLCGELPEYMITPNLITKALSVTGILKNIDPDARCGVYKSTDQGDTWNLILETVSEARGIDIDPKNNSNLYVADMMGGVWVSNDAGNTWRQENDGLGSISMTSVKIKDNCIYASTQGSGVYAGIINPDGSIAWDRERSNKPKAYVHRIQIKVDPSNPDRVYASAYPGGLLRSDDGGKHWNDKNFLTPSIRVADPLVQGYYSFDINPKNPDIVWLGVYGKSMIVSYDGMEYGMFANGDDHVMRGKHITSVKINPSSPDEIWVGTEEGMFVTRDNGKHWEAVNGGLGTLDIRSVKVASAQWPPFQDGFDDGNADEWHLQDGWSVIQENGNYVLQGTGHKWADAGSEGWMDYTFKTRLKLIQDGVHINVRKGADGRYFLAFRQNGLSLRKQFNQWSEFAHLIDKGEQYSLNQWYELKVEVKGGSIKIYIDNTLKIDYTDPNPLVSGAIAFETLDDSQVYVDDVYVEIEPADSQVYAGTGGYGIYKLDPINNRWQNLGRTLGSSWWSPWERRMYQFSSILFDPDVSGRVYYGHFPSGFFISEDNGHTWKDSSVGLGNDGIFSLSMHTENYRILYAGTYNGVVKSVDGGTTWEMKSSGMPSEQWPFTVAIDNDSPDIMYAATKNGQNKGFCHRNDFCGVVMKSTDGGESWIEIMKGLNRRSEFYSLLIYPANHDVLFLSSSKGVYISTNAGNSWETINNGLPNTDNQVRDNVGDNLAFTADYRYLILGLMNYGVWKADLSKLDLGP